MADAPMLDGRLLAQLGWVFHNEAQAVGGDPYAWPPRKALAADQAEEVGRLAAAADELFERAAALGQEQDGTDFVFGTECGGRMRNGPEKRFARCPECGVVDYEKNEGDRCRQELGEERARRIARHKAQS